MQATQTVNKGMLEKTFKLSEHNTNVKTEIISRNNNIYDNGIYISCKC